MTPRILIFVLAGAVCLSACGEQIVVKGAAQAAARAGARAVTEDMAVAAERSAVRAAAVESRATRVAVVESRGVTVTSEAAVTAEYARIVREELTKATYSTLCQWTGAFLTTAEFPSDADFRSALVDHLVAIGRGLGVSPQVAWIASYVNLAEGWTRQIESSDDPVALVNALRIQLYCA